jgi:phage gp16-like protein
LLRPFKVPNHAVKQNINTVAMTSSALNFNDALMFPKIKTEITTREAKNKLLNK